MTSKLQILSLLAFAVIAAYMYFLYKDLTAFQDETKQLRQRVTSIENVILAGRIRSADADADVDADDRQLIMATSAIIPVPLNATATVTMPVTVTGAVHEVEVEVESDDDESISSKDIKKLLTNMEGDADGASDDDMPALIEELQPKSDSESEPEPEPESVEKVVAEGAISKEPRVVDETTHAVKSPLSMTIEELNKMHYDELRNYLRKKGHSGKGKKNELITIVLGMQNQK